ncbi:hypothetical protein [Aurantiacibacter marinus]|uniref:Uncharacterized protein n=1 Tax=Aurantiacibacter marinus TaxID=874156 RepID=A0A0H0XRQ7_9SPHN|nr:hypothetical protein [Aurantiacibacter marinus]KLI62950.1 hypothetical protein AAV99_12920 [Aurantiacibacter marinus]
MSQYQIDLLFALGLPIIGTIQAIFLWLDAKAGKVRVTPMHHINRADSPRSYTIALVANVLLVAFVMLVGAYYISAVIR